MNAKTDSFGIRGRMNPRKIVMVRISPVCRKERSQLDAYVRKVMIKMGQ
jgi:hypothetical protein